MTRKKSLTIAQARAKKVAQARKDGMCATCLIVPAADGAANCEGCSAAGVERKRRCRSGDAEPRQPVDTRSQAEAARDRRDAAIAAGLCSICATNQAGPGKLKTCLECRERAASHRALKT
jgi:hypothetical protein